jgi:hypothetical protein
MILVFDPMSRRNIVNEVNEFSSTAHVDWEHDLRYRTVIQVDKTPAFLIKDFQQALATVDVATHNSIRLIAADYTVDPQSEPTPIPQIAMDQMRVINHVLHGWNFPDPVLCVPSEASHVSLVTADNASTMEVGQKHTQRTCWNGPHREKWVEAEFSQLYKHDSYGMYGKPTPNLELLPKGLWHFQGTQLYEWGKTCARWSQVRTYTHRLYGASLFSTVCRFCCPIGFSH